MNANLKEKAVAILEKLNDKKTAAVAAAVTAAPVLLSSGVSAAESSGGTVTVPDVSSTISADMLNGIVTQITNLLPVCLPTVVVLLGFRKGISFMMSMLRGA